MAAEEKALENLRRQLEGLLGEEGATILMHRLPDDEVATKTDLRSLEGRIDDRFAHLEERFEERFERIDDRFAHFGERFDLKLESLEHRLLGVFHQELSAMGMRLSEQIVAQTRNYIFSMVGAMIALGGIAVAGRLL